MVTPSNESSSGAQRVGTWLRDKYRLDRVIGEGGMATVYEATHRNKKRFAVKMLNPMFSAHGDIRARFLREGYLANTVEHPGAVAVLDDDVAEDGSAFLVMELLEGDTVENLSDLRGGRLGIPAVLALIYQVLDTLVAAHMKGVIHRDIKPANLFVTRGGVIKILDFGIARLREGDDSSSTRTGVHLGTPAFMSPEQANGRASQIDARSDIWSVGATLFFLLSGRNVHLGETAQHMVMLTATTQAAPFRSLEPGTPAIVSAVVDRALALDKSQRWPTAAAMRDAVAAAYLAIVGEPVSSRLLMGVSLRPGPIDVHSTHPSFGTEPTLTSPPGPHDVPTRVATRYPEPPITAGSAPNVSVTAGRPPAAFATMDPVSSSPSPGARRGRLIAIGATVMIAIVAGGLYLGGRAPRSSSVAGSSTAQAASPAAPPKEPNASTTGAPDVKGNSPMAPATGVAETDSQPDASAPTASGASKGATSPTGSRHGGAASSSRPNGAVAPGGAPSTAPARSGVTDFDRQ
jgi:eukaryotic-like serine/threonine-protein kinase